MIIIECDSRILGPTRTAWTTLDPQTDKRVSQTVVGCRACKARDRRQGIHITKTVFWQSDSFVFRSSLLWPPLLVLSDSFGVPFGHGVKLFAVQNVWYRYGESAGENLSQPSHALMGVEVDEISIEV